MTDERARNLVEQLLAFARVHSRGSRFASTRRMPLRDHALKRSRQIGENHDNPAHTAHRFHSAGWAVQPGCRPTCVAPWHSAKPERSERAMAAEHCLLSLSRAPYARGHLDERRLLVALRRLTPTARIAFSSILGAPSPFRHTARPRRARRSCLDTRGFLWNCRVAGGACLARFRPEGGLDRLVKLPCTWPTNCVFGGSGFATTFYSFDRIARACPRPMT